MSILDDLEDIKSALKDVSERLTKAISNARESEEQKPFLLPADTTCVRNVMFEMDLDLDVIRSIEQRIGSKMCSIWRTMHNTEPEKLPVSYEGRTISVSVYPSTFVGVIRSTVTGYLASHKLL